MKHLFHKHILTTQMAVALFAVASSYSISRAADLSGQVLGSGKAIADATVTLYAAGAGAPQQLAQGKSDETGAFTLTYSGVARRQRHRHPRLQLPRAPAPGAGYHL